MVILSFTSLNQRYTYMYQSGERENMALAAHRRSRWALPILFGISMLAFGAERDTDACAADPDIDCLLSLAERELRSIDDDRSWVTAVSEVAVAAAEAGQSERALVLLERADDRTRDLEPADKAGAIQELANALSVAEAEDRATALLDDAKAAQALVDDPHKRADLYGKWIVLRAKTDLAASVSAALEMSQADDNLAAYKARTLHELAPLQAQADQFDAALETLAAITMSISYYQAVARSDVAAISGASGRRDVAEAQFLRAEEVGREQSDGYFVAGALRQIGDGYSRLGETDVARGYFVDAAAGARTANSIQEKARALSRVATSLADHSQYDEARLLVREAIEIAASEPSEALRAWAFYEIAGAAAFSGDFVSANEVLEEIPASVVFSGVSVRSAAQRDVAWGYARHGRLDAAVAMAAGVVTVRERVQAYARIVRLLANTGMAALPRYL